MPERPNILFLMTDQMQGRVLEPDHPCLTPNLDRLAARGVRFRNAYTPNAVCSPARASLMTGLLPHNHGVLEVTHVVDDDQCCLRLDKPHWAQRLADAGYRTGYFGKWHVERSNVLAPFGWQVDGNLHGDLFRQHREEALGDTPPAPRFSLRRDNAGPDGYDTTTHYGVVDTPPERRSMGLVTGLAAEHLRTFLADGRPWCCFVSVREPHDPFVCGEAAFGRYDVDAIPLQPNARDEMADRPNIYRKVAHLWADMSDREIRECAACYYASITEIDEQYGRLLDMVERAGQLEDTLVILTADHGELLGAHGLYCKNFSAFEEVYNIPLILAGPGVARGATSSARVGLQDVCPTLLEMAGLEPIAAPDSRSFAPVLRDPETASGNFTFGFAEYHGGRYRLTQRVVWDGPWKFVHNGFDFDELYHLEEDPYEMRDLASDPAYRDRMRALCARMWRVVRDTGDRALYNSNYPILRAAPVGPGVVGTQGPIGG